VRLAGAIARSLAGQPLLLAAALLLALPSALRAQDDPLADEEGESLEEDVGEEAESEAGEEAPADEAEPGVDAEAPAVVAESGDDEPAGGVLFHAGAGLGAGSLSFNRPTSSGEQELPQTAFAAVDLLLRLRAWPDEGVAFEVQLAYQTSLGLVLRRDPQFALPEDVHVRAQRVELTAAPAVRLGDSPGDARLAFPIGFAFRAFVPEVDYLLISEYSLGGPELRVELWLALGDYIDLRVGPELQWIMLVDDALRREGVDAMGLAFGGQATLEGKIGPTFRMVLAYRELRSGVPGIRQDFSDVERFLTARIAGEL
jgi:hypothetical protein